MKINTLGKGLIAGLAVTVMFATGGKTFAASRENNVIGNVTEIAQESTEFDLDADEPEDITAELEDILCDVFEVDKAELDVMFDELEEELDALTDEDIECLIRLIDFADESGLIDLVMNENTTEADIEAFLYDHEAEIIDRFPELEEVFEE